MSDTASTAASELQKLANKWCDVGDLLSAGYTVSIVGRDKAIPMGVIDIMTHFYYPSFLDIQQKQCEKLKEMLIKNEKIDFPENNLIINMMKDHRLKHVMVELKQLFQSSEGAELSAITQFYAGLLFYMQPDEKGFEFWTEYRLSKMFKSKLEDNESISFSVYKATLLIAIMMMNRGRRSHVGDWFYDMNIPERINKQNSNSDQRLDNELQQLTMEYMERCYRFVQLEDSPKE